MRVPLQQEEGPDRRQAEAGTVRASGDNLAEEGRGPEIGVLRAGGDGEVLAAATKRERAEQYGNGRLGACLSSSWFHPNPLCRSHPPVFLAAEHIHLPNPLPRCLLGGCSPHPAPQGLGQTASLPVSLSGDFRATLGPFL